MKEFKNRVLIPLAVPLGALAIIAFVVLNISRVLLAVEERSGPGTVVPVATLLAGAVLFGFVFLASRRDDEVKSSTGLLSVVGVSVLIMGLVGFQALAEDKQKEKKEAAESAPARPDLVISAFDLGFKEKDLKIGPGKVTIQEVNIGATAHTLVIDGVVGKKLSVPSGGSKDAAAFELAAGTYTYFCDIAGHRQAGMEGKLTVDPSAPAPGAGGGGGGGGGEGGGGAAGGAPVKIDANDASGLTFTPKEATAAAGKVAVTLNNMGGLQHTLVVEEDPKFAKLVTAGGKSATGTLDAKPGTYTLFCDVPGHRAAGMETKLKVG